jgi:hypothetical protein
VPHAIYHARHDALGLTSGESTFNVLLLAGGVALAVLLLWFTWRADERRTSSRIRNG